MSEPKNRDIDITFNDSSLEYGEIRFGENLIAKLRGLHWSNKSRCYHSWLVAVDKLLNPEWSTSYPYRNLVDAASFAFARHIVTTRMKLNIRRRDGKMLDSLN